MDDSARILILENIPTDAELIEMQLKKATIAFTARRVGSKETFIKAIQESTPDLVIADYSIPRFDGLTALKEAQYLTPGVPWVIVSSAQNEEVAVNCMKAGAADYVSKRTWFHLGPSVKAVLAKKSEPAEKEKPPETAKPEPSKTRETLYKMIVEHASDLIAIIDLEGRRVYNNPAYREILEDPETLLGTNSFVDVHPEDRERVQRVFRQTVVSGSGQRMEYRLMDKDGNTRAIESCGSMVRGEGGKPAQIVIVSRDITSRKLEEDTWQELVTSTAGLSGPEYFRTLVERLASALDVRYVLVSECLDNIRERVHALAYWAVNKHEPSFEYDVTGTTCERVLKEGRLCYFPERVQELFPAETALRAMKAVSYLGIPLKDGKGNVIGHLFVMHDGKLGNADRAQRVMSVVAARAGLELERMNHENVLRTSEERLRSVIDSLGEGLIVTDNRDVITFVNRRLAEMTGYSVGELIGRFALAQIVPSELREEMGKHNERRRQGTAERYETTLKRKDNSLFQTIIDAVPYRSPEGEIIGSIAMISEKK